MNVHKATYEVFFPNIKPYLCIEPYLHLTTNTQEVEMRNILKSSMGMKSAKPRLWETPEDK